MVYTGCASGQSLSEKGRLPHCSPSATSQIHVDSLLRIRLLTKASFKGKISWLCVCFYVENSGLGQGSVNFLSKGRGLPCRICTEQPWPPAGTLSLAVPLPAFCPSPTPHLHGRPLPHLLPVSAHTPPSWEGLPCRPHLMLHSERPCPSLPRPLPALCFPRSTYQLLIYRVIYSLCLLFIVSPSPAPNQSMSLRRGIRICLPLFPCRTQQASNKYFPNEPMNLLLLFQSYVLNY